VGADDEAAEWEESADTFITGAVPLPAPGDEDDTTPRRTLCSRCLRPVKTGGDAARPTFEEMRENAPDSCWISLSGAWTWCSGRSPFVLTLTGYPNRTETP
jgi:hypothetical protein